MSDPRIVDKDLGKEPDGVFYIAVCFPEFRDDYKARTIRESIMLQTEVRPGLIDEIAQQIVPVDEQGNEIPVIRGDWIRGDSPSRAPHIRCIVGVVYLVPHIDTVVDRLIVSRKEGTLPSDCVTKDMRGHTARWVFGRPPVLATMVEWLPRPADESQADAAIIAQ